VNNSQIIDDDLPIKDISYFTDIDKAIEDNIEYYDKRKEIVSKINFEEESYQRLRFEIANYLQENKNLLKEIKEIINNNHSIIEKRNKLETIMIKLFDILVTNNNNNF